MRKIISGINTIKRLCYYAFCSIRLDIRLFHYPAWTIQQKAEFILKKYFLLVKHIFIPFNLGQSCIFLDNKKIYYESSQGLTFYQGILTKHYTLLKQSGADNNINTAIDIGANVGFFTVMLRDLNPASKLIACEPLNPAFDCLAFNCSHPLTRCLDTAVSSSISTLQMTHEASFSYLSKVNQSGKYTVSATTLDELIHKYNLESIDLIKIDTELHELEVLKGAQTALAITRFLFIEIAIKDNPHYTLSQLLSSLFSSHYNFQLVVFRNFNNKYEGKIDIMDCVFKNVKL